MGRFAADRNHGTDPTSPASLVIADSIVELQMDTTRERVIRLVGCGRNGTRTEWLLKVTGKGKLVLV